MVKSKVSKEVLSMKDALVSLSPSDKKQVVKKKDFRDFFWNYPVFVGNLFKKTLPFSYIVLFVFLGIFLVLFLQSSTFVRVLGGEKSRDTFTEGSVGAISSFNPLFVSANYVDRAVQSLVFDKLVYIDKNGAPLPGIGETWSVSSDKLEYTFSLRNDIKWQNGQQLTSQDVIFTIETAKTLSKDYGYDTVGISLDGIEVEKVDDFTVKFKLNETNPLFFEAISIYIVPYSVLGDVRIEDVPFDIFIKYPVGSGRYRVSRTEQNAVYLVDSDKDLLNPSIKNIVLRVYPDSNLLKTAFRTGLLDAVSGWDEESLSFTREYPKYISMKEEEKYRSKIIFFNLRKEKEKSLDLRKGISYLIDKQKLFEEANVFVAAMNGPYSPGSWVYNEEVDYITYDVSKGSEFLKAAGFEKKEGSSYYQSNDGEILSFTITYFESDINDRLVDALKMLLEKEGIILKTERLNYSQITQEIIATRDFELLLYEIETTVDPDQYNLWHSLKTNYPDLNLSGYSYERVDILLEEGRRITDEKIRKARYQLFQRYLVADVPVIFLYHPNFVYVVDKDIKGITLDSGNFSYERFRNIQDWYWQ